MRTSFIAQDGEADDIPRKELIVFVLPPTKTRTLEVFCGQTTGSMETWVDMSMFSLSPSGNSLYFGRDPLS